MMKNSTQRLPGLAFRVQVLGFMAQCLGLGFLLGSGRSSFRELN